MQTDSKIQLIKLLDIMMWANRVDRDEYSGQNSVYGKCLDAICEIVKTETGVNIRNCNWNLGGNASYFQDLEICIVNEKKRISRTIVVEKRTAPCTGYKAYFANDPEPYGVGDDRYDAIGDLILCTGKYEIEYKGT